jgi:carboxypeptidase T
MKALFTFFLSAMLYAQAAEKQFYVRVPFDSINDLKKYVEEGYDVGGVSHEKKTATLVVKERDLARTKNLRVISKAEILPPDPQYKKPADIEKILKDTEKKYPMLTRVERIGTSLEGRDLWAIRISNNMVAEPKPAVVFDAMHHAREVMTPEVALDIVDYLTANYATDPKVKKWVNSYNIWVVPMVNPDGNNKVWTSNRMWRKNARNGHGVDNNRNYPYAWGSCGGSSGSTSSETYRGTAPSSEPETQALMELVKRAKPKYNISYHSFSEIVIYPYGCSPKKIGAADYDLYVGVGKELAKRLVRDTGKSSYTPGTAYELLYNVDGGSIDHMYVNERVISFVIEVNSDSQGFQPSYAQWRDSTVNRMRPGWQFILDKMAEPGLSR